MLFPAQLVTAKLELFERKSFQECEVENGLFPMKKMDKERQNSFSKLSSTNWTRTFVGKLLFSAFSVLCAVFRIQPPYHHGYTESNRPAV